IACVRFRVERELDRGDLDSAEGKDRVIDALRPVFAGIPASAVREELLGRVADRIGLAPSLVASWLANGAAARPGAASRRAAAAVGAQREPAGSAGGGRPVLDAAGRAERELLAQVLAHPVAGEPTLAGLDLGK